MLIDPGVIAVVTDATFEQLPDGPYMVQTLTGETFPVSRMFEDNFQAFIGGTIAKPKHTTKSFKWMRVEVSFQNSISLCTSFTLSIGPYSSSIQAIWWIQ